MAWTLPASWGSSCPSAQQKRPSHLNSLNLQRAPYSLGHLVFHLHLGDQEGQEVPRRQSDTHLQKSKFTPPALQGGPAQGKSRDYREASSSCPPVRGVGPPPVVPAIAHRTLGVERTEEGAQSSHLPGTQMAQGHPARLVHQQVPAEGNEGELSAPENLRASDTGDCSGQREGRPDTPLRAQQRCA